MSRARTRIFLSTSIRILQQRNKSTMSSSRLAPVVSIRHYLHKEERPLAIKSTLRVTASQNMRQGRGICSHEVWGPRYGPTVCPRQSLPKHGSLKYTPFATKAPLRDYQSKVQICLVRPIVFILPQLSACIHVGANGLYFWLPPHRHFRRCVGHIRFRTC